MSKTVKKTGKNEERGYVRREAMIAVAVACLFVGYLAGSLLKNVTIGGGSKTSAFQSSRAVVPPPAAPPQQSVFESLLQKTKDNPESALVWTDLGDAYFDSGMNEAAIPAYIRSLQLAPGNPDVMTDLGIMYRRSGNPLTAVELFDQAVAADPQHVMSRFNKGIVLLYDLSDKPGTISVWQELARIAPQFRSPTGELITDLLKEFQAQ